MREPMTLEPSVVLSDVVDVPCLLLMLNNATSNGVGSVVNTEQRVK